MNKLSIVVSLEDGEFLGLKWIDFHIISNTYWGNFSEVLDYATDRKNFLTYILPEVLQLILQCNFGTQVM